MNFITYEKAYSLYPGATFAARKSLVTGVTARPGHPSQLATERALRKYKTRGWELYRRITKETRFPSGLRRVGDSKCWTMSILPKFDFPPSTIEANTWKLDHYHHWHDDKSSRIKFLKISKPHLRFDYAVASYHIVKELDSRR